MPHTRKLPTSDDQVAEEYYAIGAPALALKYGVHRTAIYKRVQEMGIPKRSRVTPIKEGRPNSPWSKRIFELTQEPVSYDRVLAEAGALVPPGRALRVRERNLRSAHETNRRARGYAGVRGRSHVSMEEAVQRGQRLVVKWAVSGFIAKRKLQYVEVNGERCLIQTSRLKSSPP